MEVLTNAEKMRKLPWALGGDFANTVHMYLTFMSTILILFLNHLKFEAKDIGTLLAIFPMVDIAAPVFMPLAARFGFKKMFVFCWASRKFVLAMMIAAPWVLQHFGHNVTFYYVAGVIALFSLCRTAGGAALGPWYQEFVPGTIRGKYGAVQNIIVVIAATGTAALVGRVLGTPPSDHGFTVLFSVAFFVGLMGVFNYSRVPGGEAEMVGDRKAGFLDHVKTAAHDRGLWVFEGGTVLITIGWGLAMTFLPLFYRNQAGLRTEEIFYLDSALLATGLVSCFLWGWAADRFGGKPVMVLNIAMMLAYPLGLLLLLPRSSPGETFWYAVGLASFTGFVSPGWNIGYSRYFYVNLVPHASRMGYMAIHTSIVGVASAASPWIAGHVLELTEHISGRLGIIHLNPYTPLFMVGLVLLLAGVFVMGQLPASGGMPVSSFAAMFLRGNPIAAMQAMVSYEFAGREQQRIATIEKLGQARSPLSVSELTGALDDPSFNVRYEAVITIARTLPHPQLTSALVKVLEGDEPDLALTAAWALGRLADPTAIPSLRKALDSPHTLLRTRAARALGMLRDADSGERLMSLFKNESEAGLRLSYASALGQLGREDALPELLQFLRPLEARKHRLEVALAVASIMGQEERAVKLWRRMEMDPGDALAGVILGLERRLTSLIPDPNPVHGTFRHIIGRSVRAFGNRDMLRGVAELRVLAAAVEPTALTPAAAIVLSESILGIDEFAHDRMEYVTLCVHSMHVGVGIDAAVR